ncbi:hypothetical protein D3C85_1257810 [compost metagenome]
MAILHSKSSAAKIIEECNAGFLITLNRDSDEAFNVFRSYLEKVTHKVNPSTNWEEFKKYRSDYLTKEQVELFNRININ